MSADSRSTPAPHHLTASRLRRRLWLVLVFVLLAAASTGAAAPPAWTTVTDGIDYRSFVLPGPVRAFVARLDLERPALILDSAIANGSLNAGLETVSGMAERYDRSLNAWEGSWGARSRVWVAINGSFFDLDTGEPEGGLIQGGWYTRRFEDLHGQSGFVFKRDRSLFTGGCTYQTPEKQRVRNLETGTWMALDGINIRSKTDRLILYSNAYGTFSPGGKNRVEIVIELARPVGLLPMPAYTSGIVRDVRDGLGPAPIMFNQVVLSMRGDRRSDLLEAFHPGDAVGISLEISDLGDDCRSPGAISWTKSFAAVDGNFVFLREGELQETQDRGALLRNPRTAICFNERYVHFVVVDGRVDAYSVGMTLPELGNFCKEKLESEHGVNYDGGGSSTMWVKGVIQNKPSDGRPRGVANGWMMISVEPAEYSSALVPGGTITVRSATNVLLGPGDNYAPIASVDTGAEGVVLPQFNGINGVLAKGTYWWYVDFGGVIGWVDERALDAGEPPAANFSLQELMERLTPPD